MITSRWRSGLALLAVTCSLPVHADDWSSSGNVFLLAWGLMAFHALQLLVSLALAIRRGRQRGWKSGLRYFGASLLMVPSTLVLLWLVTSTDGGLSTGQATLDLALYFGLPPAAVWVAFLLLVREHDRLPENQVWKQTR